MIKRRYFLSFTSEKKWLDGLNREGWELKSYTPLTYEFVKTGSRVSYYYVPLKRGKRSFIELDYKSKDKDAKALYANAEMALFKKPLDSGEFTVLSRDALKLEFHRYKSHISIVAIEWSGLAALCSVLGSRTESAMLMVLGAVSLVIALKQYFQTYVIGKFIKTL